MTAQQIDSTDDADEGGFVMEEEDGVYSFRQLYDMLIEKKEIILTIAPSELDALRTGLSMRKTKDNIKLKNAGLEPESLILKFSAYASKNTPAALDVHVRLAQRQGIRVMSLALPDNEI